MEESIFNRLDKIQSYCTRMNNRIAEIDHLGIKRFINYPLMPLRGTRLRQSPLFFQQISENSPGLVDNFEALRISTLGRF